MPPPPFDRRCRQARQELGTDLDLFVVNSAGSLAQAGFVCLLLPVLTTSRGMSVAALPDYLAQGEAQGWAASGGVCGLEAGRAVAACAAAYPFLPHPCSHGDTINFLTTSLPQCIPGWSCIRGLTPSCGSDCSGAPLLPLLYVATNLCFNVAGGRSAGEVRARGGMGGGGGAGEVDSRGGQKVSGALRQGLHCPCLLRRCFRAALELIRQAGNVAMSLTMSAIVPITVLAFTVIVDGGGGGALQAWDWRPADKMHRLPSLHSPPPCPPFLRHLRCRCRCTCRTSRPPRPWAPCLPWAP